MLRSILGLSLALGLALPLTAGEMDNDSAVKKVQPTVALSADAVSATSAVSELDKESPTQSWRRCGWGGWGCCYRPCYGWGGGYRCGWGGGWGVGYGVGYGWGGYYRPYYGGFGVSVAYAQPWGGVSFGYGW